MKAVTCTAALALSLSLASTALAQQQPARPATGATGARSSPTQQAQAQPPAAAAQPARFIPQSWTSDHPRLVEGDLVTVLVDEYTLAAADRTTSASRERSLDASLNGSFSSGAAAGRAVSGSAGSGLNNASKVDGSSHHLDQVTAEITVRVTKVEGTLLRVEGRKLLRIDGHDQQVAVSGLLRPEDLSSDNVVASSRLADARVEIAADKRLGAPSRGIFGRIIGMFWP